MLIDVVVVAVVAVVAVVVEKLCVWHELRCGKPHLCMQGFVWYACAVVRVQVHVPACGRALGTA